MNTRLRRYLDFLRNWMGHPWVIGPTIGFVLILASLFGYLDVLEVKWFDQQLRWRGSIPHRKEIVIVAIDEATFNELNRAWPFPRALVAQAIERIEEAKPKAVGLDLLFIEPSVFGPEDDAALAAVLKQHANVVLGALAEEQRVDTVYAGGTVMNIGRGQLKLPIEPLRIREDDSYFGFVNVNYDVDGFVRSAPLYKVARSKRWATLTGQLFDIATRDERVRVRRPPGLEMMINYRGPERTFSTIAFHQVLRKEIEPQELAGKIVLIGATSQVLHDVFGTPFAPKDPMPGVEVQANILDNLLRGDPLRPAGLPIALLLMVVMTAAATFLATRLSPFNALAAVVGMALAYAFLCYGMLAWFRVWIQEVRVQLALVAPYGAIVVRHFIHEERAKRRLSRFFSPAVVQDILKQGQNLGSERRKITILFSDIRNFTTISENLAPEGVVQALRLYFNTMTPIIFRNGGSVDKFVGDAIMAFFNAPNEDRRHADHAVKAAIEMVRAVEGLSPHWEAMTGHSLKIGVGINTGEPVIGTMGSDERLEYSCIGDAVNLAARLESVTKEVKRDIVISEYTYKELTETFELEPLEEIHVKGRAQAVQIYGVATRDVADERGLRDLIDETLATMTMARPRLS